jgi:hypothetical protein
VSHVFFAAPDGYEVGLWYELPKPVDPPPHYSGSRRAAPIGAVKGRPSNERMDLTARSAPQRGRLVHAASAGEYG